MDLVVGFPKGWITALIFQHKRYLSVKMLMIYVLHDSIIQLLSSLETGYVSPL
jgi:hypothetical protein